MSKLLLIDYKTIVKPNMVTLKKRIGLVPKTAHSIGIILKISTETYDKLSDIPKSKKLAYINTEQFVKNIISTYTFVYNRKRKICEIWKNYTPKSLKDIINAIFNEFPGDFGIWVGINISSSNFNNLVEKYVKLGFKNPYISSKSLLGYKFPGGVGLGMYRENRKSPIPRTNFVLNSVKYTLQQYTINMKKCSVKLQFTPQAVKTLKSYVYTGYSLDKNGKNTQKELGGTLFISDVNEKLVYKLSVDTESVVMGEEEEVNVWSTRYNFHSHPKDAYTRHSVKNGWPSVTDFLGFVDLGKDTIMHVVSSKEGLYIISYAKTWDGKTDIGFIEKNFDIDLDLNMEKPDFIKMINSIEYKDKGPIFEVQWIPWKKASKTVFTVYFDKTLENCLVTDEVYRDFTYFYKT